MSEDSQPFTEIFNDPEHAARYAEGPARFMPGFHSIHRMACVLMRETAPDNAHVLVHGAGGGLEIEALREITRPGASRASIRPSPCWKKPSGALVI